MIKASQLKNGEVIEVKGAPCMVEMVTKQTPSARGAATIYKIRARNLLNRQKVDQTCRGDDAFDQPEFEQREVQYSYQEQSTCIFMDIESYEQLEIATSDLTEELPFLKEGMEGLSMLILEGRPVGLRLPDTVELKLVECDPAIKGASASARTKPAITETGLTIQVPEYMEPNVMVRIDVRTGKYLYRV